MTSNPPELIVVPEDEALSVVQNANGDVVTARLPGGVAFGWKIAELVDVTLIQLVHPEDQIVAYRGRSWCLATGTSQTIHLRLRAPGGRWTWSETTYRRVDLDGEWATEAQMSDVSEMALSNEALGLVLDLRAFIDRAADADDGWREVLTRLTRYLNLDRAYVWRLRDGVPHAELYVGDVAAPPRPFDPAVDGWLLDLFDVHSVRTISTHRSRDARVDGDVNTLSIPVTEGDRAPAVVEFESNSPIRGTGVGDVAGEVFDRLADALRRKQIETELDLTRQQLGLAFDEAPIGIALVGADGRFLRVNRALTELLERSEAELLELGFQDVNHAEDVAVDVGHFDELLAGLRDRYQIETRFVRSDQSVVWTLFSVAVVRDRDGEAVQFIVQFVDISAQKAREFQLARRHNDIAVADPVEALDMFLQSHDDGLPMGLIVARFEWPNDPAGQAEIERAFTRQQRSTRTDDHFVRVGDGVAMVVASALSADPGEMATQLEAIRSRITAGLAQAAPDQQLTVGVRGIDPQSARARDLLSLAISDKSLA